MGIRLTYRQLAKRVKRQKRNIILLLCSAAIVGVGIGVVDAILQAPDDDKTPKGSIPEEFLDVYPSGDKRILRGFASGVTLDKLSKYSVLYIYGDITDIQHNAFDQIAHPGDIRHDIPDSIDNISFSPYTDLGYNIEQYAFRGSWSLDHFKYFNHVNSIGDYAFAYCSNIVNVPEFDSDLISIGKGAFEGCARMSGELTVNNTIASIGESAFEGCESLTGTLSVSSLIQSIPRRAFYDCVSISDVEMYEGSNLLHIGDEAFEGCENLESFDLSVLESLEDIGYESFAGCTKLTEVNIDGLNLLSEIGDSAFEGCTALEDVNFGGNNMLWSLGESCFKDCTSLQYLDTQDTYISVFNDNCFSGCTSIAGTFIFPQSTQTIGSNVLLGSTVDQLWFKTISPIPTIKIDSLPYDQLLSDGGIIVPRGEIDDYTESSEIWLSYISKMMQAD